MSTKTTESVFVTVYLGDSKSSVNNINTVIMKLVTNLAGIPILIFKSGFFTWCEVVHCMISGRHFPVKTLASPFTQKQKSKMISDHTNRQQKYVYSKCAAVYVL